MRRGFDSCNKPDGQADGDHCNEALRCNCHARRPRQGLGSFQQTRDGAIIFSDLIGKLGVLRVTCEKCGRDRRFILARLIRNRGRDA